MNCLENKIDLSINLLEDLVKFNSVYPNTKDIIDYIYKYLNKLGFSCFLFDINNCSSLYAEFVNENSNLNSVSIGFAGHVDVVPEGSGWKNNPFELCNIDNNLHARGTVDMKGAIACFLSSVSKFIHSENLNKSNISKIGLIIAGDEEVSINESSDYIAKWLKNSGKNFDLFIVGEPTNPNKMGEMVKIGRRGSISGTIKIIGKQGHVAYPENAINPFKIIPNIVDKINCWKIDEGNEYFSPSNIELVFIKSSTNVYNIIPSEIDISFNIRFNNILSAEQIIDNLKKIIDLNITEKYNYSLGYKISALPFINYNNMVDKILNILEKQNGFAPVLSTSGGTSDARFISKYFNCIEYGLVNKTAHQVDEFTTIDDMNNLTKFFDLLLETL
jgi:succinyl-diaminopimelate desuccinylase